MRKQCISRPDDSRGFITVEYVLAADAATLGARRTLQVHGAMGYTWEYDLQIWMKRVWAEAPCWGTSAWHRSRIAGAILAPNTDLGPGRTWAA